MFISFFRTFKFALQDFWRNFWLSVITTSILALALISVNILLVLNMLAGVAVDAVENKISVSVYLKPSATEEVVANMRMYVANDPHVADVKVTTPEEALENLKRRHPDSEAIQRSVEELGRNPLGPSLAIKARNTQDYPAIIAALDHPTFGPYIQEKNFDDHKIVISRIRTISDKVQRTALFIFVLFALISVLIVWNAIRIIIYTHREEIGIMRLVGASSWFIRMPYIFESIFYSILATGIAAGVVFFAASAVGPSIMNFFDGTNFDLLGYFKQNGLYIFGAEFAGAAVLCILTTGIAVGRYLKK